MTMASYGSGGYGSLTSSLDYKKSVPWKGFRSREIWERSQSSAVSNTGSMIISVGSSACVSSPEHFRSSATNMAQKASVSSRHDRNVRLSSSFWGSGDGDAYSGLRMSSHPSDQSRRASRGQARAPGSMPLVEARLFGPSIFNATKLRVLLLGKDDQDRPLQHPRIYTLTHSDVTAKITLAVAREINKAQVMGWYSKFQRDEVVAEWRRTQGETSLHVHCHISGTNFLHRLIAKLRFYIFQKELPLVLEAFMHGDRDLFEKHPELQNAPVWVYFHSNVEDYNRVECWGPLVDATKRSQIQQLDATNEVLKAVRDIEQQSPAPAVCLGPCECCSRHASVIPIPESLNRLLLQAQVLSMKGQSSIISKVQKTHHHGHSDRTH